MPVHKNNEKDAFDLISISSENNEPVEDEINDNTSSTDEYAMNSIEEVTIENHNQFGDDDANSLETSALDIACEDLLAEIKKEKTEEDLIEKVRSYPSWPCNNIGAKLDDLNPTSRTDLYLHNINQICATPARVEYKEEATKYVFDQCKMSMEKDVIHQPKLYTR